MIVKSIQTGIAIAALALAALPAVAEPADVKIQVCAVDAKFIGSGVGGMNTVVENAQTGALLASGEITGTTGDTAALMTSAQTRRHASVTPDSMICGCWSPRKTGWLKFSDSGANTNSPGQAEIRSTLGPGDPWRAGAPMQGQGAVSVIPAHSGIQSKQPSGDAGYKASSRCACLRLPGSENSCMIGAGKVAREGGERVWQPAEKSKKQNSKSGRLLSSILMV